MKKETYQQVIYAGGSQRRKAFLEKGLPNVKVKVHGGVPEPDTPEVLEVARHKIEVVKSVLLGETTIFLDTTFISADARTEVSKLGTSNGGVIFVSQGKPKFTQTVRANFKDMRQASGVNGSVSYRVRVASLVEREGIQQEGLQTVGVIFAPGALEFLSTDMGFQAYLNAYDAFYRRPPYSSYGLEPIRPTHISGGLSLPVLVSMRLVDGLEIDGTEVDVNEQTLSQSIFAVAVGFAPNVL